MIKKTLYFGNPAYLSLRNRQLVIKLPVETPESEHSPTFNEVTKPIEDIGIVVLDHRQITITTAALTALAENNCAVINCDSKSMPASLMLPLYGNTIQTKRYRQQIDASQPLLKQLWQQTVRQKILNQKTALLLCTGEDMPCMQVWASEVRSGDADNHEARAAAFYWKNFLPGTHFIRDREGLPPNNLLNYGYAILRAVVTRALVASGLLPTLGIHHHNRYNAYCLADDIMEPYRPYVDCLVHQMATNGTDCTQLSKNVKAQLLGIPTLDVRLGQKNYPLMVAASLTASSLYKCFDGELRKIAYPELS